MQHGGVPHAWQAVFLLEDGSIGTDCHDERRARWSVVSVECGTLSVSYSVGVGRYLRSGDTGSHAVAEGTQMHGMRGCGTVPKHMLAAAQHTQPEEFNLIPLKYQQQNNCYTSLGACCHKKPELNESSSNDKSPEDIPKQGDDDDQLHGKVVVVVPPNRNPGDTLSVWHELEGKVYEVAVPEGAVPGDRISVRYKEGPTKLSASLSVDVAIGAKRHPVQSPGIGDKETGKLDMNELTTVFSPTRSVVQPNRWCCSQH